jgi:hypothetical protein
MQQHVVLVRESGHGAGLVVSRLEPHPVQGEQTHSRGSRKQKRHQH